MTSKNLELVYAQPTILDLVRYMKDGGGLEPEHDGQVLILGKDREEIDRTLSKMVETGIVNRTYRQVSSCENCRTLTHSISPSCQTCSSTQVTKSYTLGHKLCGKSAESKQFYVNGNKCFGCEKEVNPKDLITYGYAWVCPENHRSAEVDFLYFCTGCNHTGKLATAPLIEISSYRLDDNESRDLIIFSEVREVFSRNQFKVVIPGLVRGKSGTEHMYSILAEKENRSIGLDFIPEKVNVVNLSNTYVRRIDTETETFIFGLGEAEEDAKKMAVSYGVKIIASSKSQIALDELEKALMSPTSALLS